MIKPAEQAKIDRAAAIRMLKSGNKTRSIAGAALLVASLNDYLRAKEKEAAA